MATSFYKNPEQLESYMTEQRGDRRRIYSRYGICWKSAAAGFFIALLTHAIITSVGLAFSGLGVLSVDTSTGFAVLSTATMIWIILSSIISLFVGGYVAARVSNFTNKRLGSLEGILTSALFFIAILLPIGVIVGGIASGAAKLAGTSVQSAASHPVIQSFFEDELLQFGLKKDPATLIQGVALRFAMNDQESAKSYLKANSNFTDAEMNAQFASLVQKYDAVVEKTKEAAGQAMAALGWTFSMIFILGTLAGGLGGAVAARRNLKAPLSTVAV